MYESFSSDVEIIVAVFGCFMVIVSFLCIAGLVTWVDLFIEKRKKTKEIK